jgi:hypothetical protein
VIGAEVYSETPNLSWSATLPALSRDHPLRPARHLPH